MQDERLRRVPGWDEMTWISAGFSTRLGGVTQVFGQVGDLNLGFVPEDAQKAVEENRRLLVATVAGEGWRLAMSRQVHGTAVREITEMNFAEAMPEGRGAWEADGLITDAPGFLLGAGAADCVPMLVADARQRAVGAFHAGWRGTAAGMAAVGLAQMRASFGTRPEDCVAAVGPSIGACCYEVGEEVRAAFGQDAVFRAGPAPGKWRLDLWEANRRQLVAAGVPVVTVMGECTACTRETNGQRRYFSYRAEGGRTGRMLGVIGVRKGPAWRG